MRIREIRIDGFGQFANRRFGALERPVTVFLGPNEAGKSTLLEFVRRVLFGFPRKSGKVNAYPALAGGNYGGHITIEGADGRVYDVRRTTGKSYSGDVLLTSATGDTLPESELASLFGHHSKEVFERVFAFTLDDLYSDDLLSDANVNSQIYSAGMGVTSLPNAVKSIESSRIGIFLKGGSTQKIYEIHNKIEKIDNRLREVSNNATTYGELTDRLQRVEVELGDLAAQQLENQSRYNRQITFQKGWDAWNDLNSAEEDLTGIPDIDKFPADGVNRLEALQERVNAARREYESAGQRAAKAERAAEVRVEHEAILEYPSEVRRLQNGRTAFDGSVNDLPERETELEGHKRTLAETLKGLGPDWDDARLQEFDLSISVRQQISEHGDRMSAASARLSDRKSTRGQHIAALEEARDAEIEARRRLEAAVSPDMDADRIRRHRNLVRVTRSQLDEIKRQRQNVLNLKSQLESLKTTASQAGGAGRSTAVGAVSFAIGLVLLIGGAYLGGTALIIGVGAGIALTGMGIYVLVSARSGLVLGGESPLARPVRDSLRRAEANIEDLLSKMMRDAAPLNLEVIDESSLLSAEQSIDEEEDLLQERTHLSETLEAVTELAKQRQIRADKSAAAVGDAEGRLKAAQREWQEWLRARGLSEAFAPETADVLQSQVELGRGRLDDVRNWQQRIRAIRKDIDEYVEALEPLANAFDVTFDRSDWRTVAAAADRLVELMEEVKESTRNRTDAELELKNAQRQLDERSSDLQKAEDERDHLLQSGGAEDAEAFRVRAGLSERRTELEDKARDALHRLQRLSGPGEPLEMLKSDLGNTNPQAIADEMAGLEEERTTANAQREALSTQRGSIRTELDGLVGEEESSQLRMERNVLLEQIRGHAREWTRLTLARNLLEEARRKFEQERQPGVVRHAEEFFTAITDGRYRQAYAPLGEQTITVTDADGRTKQPSELSRGTREQLFLSLRFGLIRELGQRTEPLPVVVDEVLVNFDPQRALGAATAFTELSKTNQVLVFTCHPTVVDLFHNTANELSVEKPDVVQIM